MALTDANGFPLKFEAEIDDRKARQKIDSLFKDIRKQGGETVKDILKDLNVDMRPAAESLKDLTTQAKASTQATNTTKEAQLAYMDSLRQSRLEIQKQREEQARLKVAYDEGRISQQQYRIEAAKFSLEERKKAAALREAKKEISNNSEYQKLSRALGTLRTESKNVLAEMYKLETQGKKGSTSYQDLANKARGLVSQTNALDTGLKKIDASLGLHQRNVGNYGSALDAISPQFARINSQMQMMGVNLTELGGNKNAFKELGASIISMGKSIGMFLISPIGLAITTIGGLFALIRGNKGTVMEFNSGLLNVSKTTGIAGAELDRLGKSVIGLSRSLQTVSTDKLLDYATVAGQLGVKGTANIMAFTEALAKLETASDITGEQGGSEIARLLTLTDGGVQNVKNFGDEIVNLGNNFAATESEILGNATAISQNVGLYRIGRQDVLAYAAATKSVGLEAEVVGSTFNRTLAEFEKTIRTGKGLAQTLAVIGGSADELQKRFKTDASGVFNDYITGLNKIHREGGSVNKALTETGVIAVRDQRVIASLATNGYDVLTAALENVRDAAGSLDEEFNTAAGKLENQTKRISIAWNNLVFDIENGTGIIGKSAVWLSGIFADALDRISKIVAPTGWNEFLASLTSFQAADVIREINIAVKESGEAMQSAMDLDLSKANSDKITETMDTLVSAQDQATKSIELYKKAVESGLLTDKGRTRISELEGLLNRLSSKINQVSMFVPAAKTGGTGAAEGNTLTEAEIKAQARAHETMVNAQRAMQAKIDEMNQSAKRKNLKDGEEEVQAIKDKYAKLTEEAVRFNADPKNKIKVNLSGLVASESGEISEANYKADTVLLKKGLDEQLKLYNDFEASRKATSLKVAEERYKDQLDLIRGYEGKLRDEIAKLENKDRSKEEENRYKQLTEDQKKFNEARLKDEETEFIAAYNLSESYTDKLLDIEEKYSKARADLGRFASKEQLEILNKGQVEEISALTLAEIHKSEIYKKANEQALLMTREQIKEQIKALKTLLDNGDISEELKARLKTNIEGLEFSLKIGVDESNVRELERKKNEIVASIQEIKLKNISSPEIEKELKRLIALLVETQTEIDAINETGLKKFFEYLKGDGATIAQGLSYDLRNISGSFYELSDALGGVDTSAGYTLDTIGQLVEVGSDAAGAFASFASGDIVGGITKTIKAVSGVFSIGKKVKEMNAAARKEVADFYENAIKGEKAYQDALKAREIQIIRNNKAVLEGIRDEMALRKEQSASDGKEADEIMKKLSGMNYVSGETYKHGTWFRKAKVTKHYESLRGKSFEDLSLLLEQGKLEGEALKLVERLVELENQGHDTTQIMADLAKEVESIFTGSTSDNLSNSLLNMFKEGKTGAQDLADFFESTMQDAALSIFKNKVLDSAMEGFYEKFAESALSGDILTDNEIADLKKLFDSITDGVADQFENLEKITGLSFGKIAKDIGVSLESIESGLVDLFASGTASAEDFGKNFEDIMKQAILNTFKANALTKELEVFYNQFTELATSGDQLTKDEIAQLKSQYDKIIKDGQEKFKQMEEVTGIGFKAETEATGLKGAIRRELTEQTGGELAGLFRAQYDLSKNLLALHTKEWSMANNYNRTGVEHLVAIQANTFRTANNTESLIRLENIESHLARLAGANGGMSANKHL